VFPQPGDNAFMGRGSADVIVKQDEILIRAGKFKGNQLQPNVIPVANQQRGFLQLSKFQSTLQPLEPKVVYELQEEVLLTKYLIEWTLTNPENTQDRFSGSVYLYQLKPNVTVNSKFISVDSEISENLKKLVAIESFAMLSKMDTIKFINDFIKQCNDTDVTRSGVKLFNDNNAANKFPIYYRPNSIMYSKLNPSTPLGASASPIEVSNISEIYKGVKLNPALRGGYGLIYAKDKVGIPKTPKKFVIPQQKYVNQESTYGALGSDILFLVSHNSQIPGKGKINFDDTLYGISPEKFTNELLPKTSSMVRGEELLELINLIVKFLVTHTHAYPGLPPVPVTQEGTNTQSILTELNNAVNKILSKNIRLN
jgi:hypothetical protein